MTVQELIAKLSVLDPDMPVAYLDSEDGWLTVDHVTDTRVIHRKDWQDSLPVRTLAGPFDGHYAQLS